MKLSLILLAALCGLVFSSPAKAAFDPCMDPNTGKSSAAIGITTATTTALVTASATKVVYVCSFSLTISQVVTTANILTFEGGTGTACAANAASLTGGFGTGGITAGTPITVTGGSGGTIFQTALGSGLCAVTTIGGSAAFSGYVNYVQM